MDPHLDSGYDMTEDLTGLFENPLVNDRGPNKHAARRALERLMEERALRAHLQDDFDLDHASDPLDW
ncbi:PA3496 family putative envelope integrity protein [Thioalkalivibrio sp. HL-Eb18]|jgi:hypothetical protein|uniref:PA3496 family putative envelope integrity protein n=1 Tax=Thioalkalivibrio sp. HL-Eb18 TaxID=1266913 RepID=UPI000372B09C|nr:hypothetical protein [Thioalkalivibrio sp. HL-Eb18]